MPAGTISLGIKPIPKTIQLVWVGKNIPVKYLHHILSTLAFSKAQGFTVQIWTTKQNRILQSAAMFDVLLPGLKIRYADEVINFVKKAYKPNVSKKILAILTRELAGFHNFAAYSDLFRLLVLKMEGGYYLDADLRAFHSIKAQFAKHEFLIAFTKDETGSIDAAYNAAMASLPNHQILDEAINELLNHYDDLDNELADKEHASSHQTRMDHKRQFCHDDRINLTVETSGPGLMHDIIMKYVEPFYKKEIYTLGILDIYASKAKYIRENLAFKLEPNKIKRKEKIKFFDLIPHQSQTRLGMSKRVLFSDMSWDPKKDEPCKNEKHVVKHYSFDC